MFFLQIQPNDAVPAFAEVVTSSNTGHRGRHLLLPVRGGRHLLEVGWGLGIVDTPSSTMPVVVGVRPVGSSDTGRQQAPGQMQ